MDETRVNGTPADGAPVRSLVDLLRRRASESPGTVGYRFLRDGETGEGVPDEPLTWGELDRRARAIAAALAEAGAAGERALLLYPPGLDYLAAFFGCLYAGAVAVPVYPPRPRRGNGGGRADRNRSTGRVLSILRDARAGFALTTGELLAGIEGMLPAGVGAGAAGPRWIATDRIEPERADLWRPPAVGADSLAFLQYTSGSTAEPKGVMLRHGNLLHNLELIRRAFGIRSDDRAVIWLPPYHDMGLIGGILQPLYAGFPVTLFSPMAFLQRPARWLEAISRTGASVSGGPNFAYDLAVRKTDPEQRAALDLSSWRLAFNGAEPVRAETLVRFAKAFAPAGFDRRAFYPCYGLAEGTLLVTGGGRGEGARVERFRAAELEAHRAVRADQADGPDEAERMRVLVASGRTPGGQRVLVVDPERGAPCSEGEVGEIWIAGPSVAAGYWGKGEATTETFGARLAGAADGPYLRTGDLGFLDHGELFVTGRIKDLIILRGRNCYPQDLELSAERAHPALRAGGGAAFGVEADGEERLVLVQELRRDRLGDDPVAIAGAVRRVLAQEHEVQLHALALIKPATLPKTSSGKVRRRATREAFVRGELDLVALWPDGVAARSASVPASPSEPGPEPEPFGTLLTPAPAPDEERAAERPPPGPGRLAPPRARAPTGWRLSTGCSRRWPARPGSARSRSIPTGRSRTTVSTPCR